MEQRRISAIIICLFIFSAPSSFAFIFSKKDKELAESSKCAVHFDKLEHKYRIPRDLLHSISLQESGKKHSKSAKKIPWPWAVSLAGKPHYFESKRKAVNFVISEIAKGRKNIDVGCMQISMLYHRNSFKTISEAFEPEINIAYGAAYLRKKYDKYKSWRDAIANYHSSDKEKGKKYHQSVLKIASNIEKYKFFKQKPKDISEAKGPLIKPNIRNDKMHEYYNRKEKKIKSDMMVYIPKTSQTSQI